MSWRQTPIDRTHDRKGFDCGEPPLNQYLQRFARQNHESGGTKTYVATPLDEDARILGYYSLCPASLTYAKAPKVVTRGLGRYDVPVYRLGRLAVDLSQQGKGLGGELFAAACRRCITVASEVGGIGILIDAKSDRAAKWYQKLGAVPLDDDPLSLVLLFATFAEQA
jgi:GNAT superfamily N-acetyltransferase